MLMDDLSTTLAKRSSNIAILFGSVESTRSPEMKSACALSELISTTNTI